ncbi:hypothetical protein [Cellulophaga sp. L1A9]|uniref:hypothetical protein n=1 Tax=Cellulophaga sp. L1A9 TaxID=2686362 RepID=UPI00131BD438|nr:hypothetical protein [Cellulophaga sp. L1A9]
MKKVISSCGSKFNAFCCTIFGHHYTMSRKVTSHIKEYKCLHCEKQVTTDANGKLARLTPEMKDINATLENLYQKRHRASHQQVA